MNDKMQEQASKIIEMIVSGLEKASDVASAELPGLINDYLSYYMIDAIPVKAMVVIPILIWLSIYSHKNIKKYAAL